MKTLKSLTKIFSEAIDETIGVRLITSYEVPEGADLTELLETLRAENGNEIYPSYFIDNGILFEEDYEMANI